MAPREGVEIARSIGEAAALAGEDAVLMGGAQLYRALLPRCKRVLVTQVDAAAEGRTPSFRILDASAQLDRRRRWGNGRRKTGLAFATSITSEDVRGTRPFRKERKPFCKCGENEYNEGRFSERRRGPWRS